MRRRGYRAAAAAGFLAHANWGTSARVPVQGGGNDGGSGGGGGCFPERTSSHGEEGVMVEIGKWYSLVMLGIITCSGFVYQFRGLESASMGSSNNTV